MHLRLYLKGIFLFSCTLSTYSRTCASYGLLVLLCDKRHHLEDGVKQLWYDGVGNSEERILRGWDAVMNRLASKWNLFAVDLADELGAATWGMGLSSDWNIAAEQLIKHLATNHSSFAGLFFVQGVGASGTTDSSFPKSNQGGHLQGVQTHSISTGQPSIDGRVVYSPHAFGPDYTEESYFQTDDFPRNMPLIWQKQFGFIPNKTGHPVIVGAWGGRYEPSSLDEQYQNELARYLIENCMTSNFYWSVNGQWAFDPIEPNRRLSESERQNQNAQLGLLKRLQPRPTRLSYSQNTRFVGI
uniref:Glycoside hydrolase family 5 domain-containing protein n=1 Tax=Plectus sambesii TaxID=2011161 RepID=A0A914W787_9BILA